MKIANRDDIIIELAAIMMKADIDCNEYQTDVYLYIDKDTDIARLDTFVNVGGNSWLNDDHLTVWIDRQHLENHLDYFETIEEIADALGMTSDELRVMTVQTLYAPEDGMTFTDMTWSDVYQMIRQTDDLNDKLREAYEEAIREHEPEYQEQAEEALRQLESYIEEEEALRREWEA